LTGLTTDIVPQEHLDSGSRGIRHWIEARISSIPYSKLRHAAEILLAVTEPTRSATFCREPVQSAERACGEITILSSNLWHDWPKFRRIHERLEHFARLVEDVGADIVLAQELSRSPVVKTDEWLANRLGMAYVYTRANGSERAGFEEGLGIFSKFTLGEPRLRQMPSGFGPFVRRLALGAPVSTPCGNLLAFSVHLSILPIWNRLQLKLIQDWVSQLDGGLTSLVGGDFNAGERTSRIRRIRARWIDTFRHLHPHAEGGTHEIRLPWGRLRCSRLDYIFLNPGNPGWEIKETLHLESPFGPHSDHRAVLTRLTPGGCAGLMGC
jgi:endonuclease/exonuclease/phosphatase family metal-dependent hydrolase